jgi:hypothetical protein
MSHSSLARPQETLWAWVTLSVHLIGRLFEFRRIMRYEFSTCNRNTWCYTGNSEYRMKVKLKVNWENRGLSEIRTFPRDCRQYAQQAMIMSRMPSTVTPILPLKLQWDGCIVPNNTGTFAEIRPLEKESSKFVSRSQCWGVIAKPRLLLLK